MKRVITIYNPMNSMKRQNDRILKEKLPRSVGAQYARSSPRLTSIESVMQSGHLILCRPLLLLPPIPPSIIGFSNESTPVLWPSHAKSWLKDFDAGRDWGQEEKEMATHSSILAWRTLWTEEPGGLLSIASQSRTWLKWLRSSSNELNILFYTQSSKSVWILYLELIITHN